MALREFGEIVGIVLPRAADDAMLEESLDEHRDTAMVVPVATIAQAHRP